MASNKKYVDMENSEKYNFWIGVKAYFREYAELSGIHGLLYLTEKRTIFEKIFWGLTLLTSLGGCILMIYQIVERYQNNPIVVSFATKDTPLFNIPFPAVTICPESKCLEENFNYTDVYYKVFGSYGGINYTEMRNFYYISLLCNSDEQNVFFTNFYNETLEVENDFMGVINELRPNELIDCSFMGEDCLEHLSLVLTDQGICYSFNIVDQKDMFRQDVIYYKPFQNSTPKRLSYNSDSGYSANAGINAYPKRALLSGVDGSLRIRLKHIRYASDLLCNKYQQGYQVLLHNPLEFPRLCKSYFRIPLQKTVVAMVEPTMLATTAAIKTFSPDARNCYLEDERPLLYFKPYTQLNCLLECETNYTLKLCGCVNYHMPRHNNTKICGIKDHICARNTLNGLQMYELNNEISGFINKPTCDCKPSCTSLQYNAEKSLDYNYIKDYFKMTNVSALLGLEKYYFSTLFVYFKSDQFIAVERNELYGPSDLVANFGGLLGLFTGFSLISGVEMIYFATIRIFYNIRVYGRWFGRPN